MHSLRGHLSKFHTAVLAKLQTKCDICYQARTNNSDRKVNLVNSEMITLTKLTDNFSSEVFCSQR